jgi:signal transduction histidine kinase
MATAPGFEVFGRRALADLGARLTLVHLCGAALGVVIGAGGGRRAVLTGLEVGLLGLLAAAAVRGGDRRAAAPSRAGPSRSDLGLLVAVAAGVLVLAGITGLAPQLPWSRVQVLAGWVVPGLGLGIALAAGAVRGVIGFTALVVGCLVMLPPGQRSGVGPAAIGAVVAVAVGVVIRVGVVRGQRTTQAAVRAAADEQIRARQQVRARRRTDRMLHDTVLNTLTLLAHGGVGVADPQLLRQACRRDLVILAGGPRPAPRPVQGAGPARCGGADPSWPPADRLGDLRALAAGRGIDLRVHVQSAERDAEAADPGPGALDAWSGALAECVANIARHADVAAADVVLGRTDDSLITVLVDEGAGFEPAEVGPGRLGLSGSVVDRLEDVGGRARIWSRPGQGTVVELRLPLPRSSSAGGEGR